MSEENLGMSDDDQEMVDLMFEQHIRRVIKAWIELSVKWDTLSTYVYGSDGQKYDIEVRRAKHE